MTTKEDGLLHQLFYGSVIRSKRLFWMSYVLFYMMLILLCKVSFDTFYPIAAPVVLTNITIATERSTSGIGIRYNANQEVLHEFEGSINMEIVHKDSNVAKILPGALMEYSPHKINYQRQVLTLPEMMPNGRYNVRAWVTWRPTFSILNHHRDLQSTEFEVCNTKCKS